MYSCSSSIAVTKGKLNNPLGNPIAVRIPKPTEVCFNCSYNIENANDNSEQSEFMLSEGIFTNGKDVTQVYFSIFRSYYVIS